MIKKSKPLYRISWYDSEREVFVETQFEDEHLAVFKVKQMVADNIQVSSFLEIRTFYFTED